MMKPYVRGAVCALIGSTLGALAQDMTLPNLTTGQTLQPKTNLYLYAAAPNATFGDSKTPVAILAPTEEHIAHYPLTATDAGLVVQPASATNAKELMVRDHVDVLSGNTLTRWIQVEDTTTAHDISGWIACGPSTDNCKNLFK